MWQQENLKIRKHLRQAILIAACCGTIGLNARGQQFEEPAVSDTSAQEEVRIVDDRPKLHFFKRTFHPLTLMDFTFKPILRFAESRSSSLPGNTDEKPEKIAGVKFSIDNTGASSGIGPEIRPYHRDLFGTGVEIEMPLLLTYKRYESYQLLGRVPLVSREGARLVSFELSTGYRSRAADNLFGLGNDTERSSRTRFRSVIREAAAAVNVRLSDAWLSRIQVGHRNIGITRPYAEPSALEAFRDVDVPGLFTGARLLSTSVSVERNTTDDVVPSSGGVHRLEIGVHEGSRKGDWSYWKYRYDGQHFIPISDDGRKVIGLRGRLETNEEKGGSEIPFFDLPYVGGRSTIRGYDSFRFIDKSALSIGAEYRYRIWQAFDVGLFVDRGQVAPEIGDFAWDRFHTGYGARLIMRASSKFAVNIDAGRSAESWKLYIDFNSAF